jgi:hypothetical protein
LIRRIIAYLLQPNAQTVADRKADAEMIAEQRRCLADVHRELVELESEPHL